MTAFGYHYPPGAEHDPSAPWNQPSDCEECDGTGQVEDSDGPDECQVCGGSGLEKTAADRRRDWEEWKADAERDDE